MKKVLCSAVVTAIFSAAVGIQAAQAQPLIPVLTCHFEQEHFKGDEEDCSAVFSQPLDSQSAPASRPASPNNLFVVTCDHGEVYSGGGFEKTEEFTGMPEFGMGIVTAINVNIAPEYPAVFVDGDFENLAYSFHDRPARLYFSHDKYILGACDHSVAPPPPASTRAE